MSSASICAVILIAAHLRMFFAPLGEHVGAQIAHGCQLHALRKMFRATIETAAAPAADDRQSDGMVRHEMLLGHGLKTVSSPLAA